MTSDVRSPGNTATTPDGHTYRLQGGGDWDVRHYVVEGLCLRGTRRVPVYFDAYVVGAELETIFAVLVPSEPRLPQVVYSSSESMEGFTDEEVIAEALDDYAARFAHVMRSAWPSAPPPS